MPIQTNLSNPPYNDTVPVTSDYLRVLTKPGATLQSREIIEMQSIFATQLERFADNVLKPGSIVSGCNFTFLNPFPYVKLQDQDVLGNPVSPSAYANLSVINLTSGLRALIVDTADGFVSSDPDLKTLYLKYMNTGYTGNAYAFNSGDILRVYDPIRNGIEQVTIQSSGQGFSNTNPIFAVSPLAVTMVSGTLSNGQYIVNGQGANVQIVGVDSTTLANSGQLILTVAPRSVDLANVSVNATSWTMANGQSFTNSGNTASGYVSGVIGYGYQGLAVTDSLGSLTQILTLNKGFGYTTPPYITLQSANNQAGYGTLNLVSQNYVASITVASTSNSVGNAYAFSVTPGSVYLSGAFLRVPSQTIVVSKYDQNPSNVSVCFVSTENIVTADIDETLNDPSAGSNGAPGADRLQIEPILKVIPTVNAIANSQTLPLVSWSEGNPYIQNQPSQYSKVGDAIALAASDLGGNFYIDPFLVTTSVVTTNVTPVRFAATFDAIVDPGSAYINGYKVQTDSNYVQNLPYSFDTTSAGWNVSLNYGNYLVVKELGGTFQFNTGDVVTLYSQPKGYISNSALVRAANTTPQGTALGTAHIRGLQHLSGIPGTNTATYALYLFGVTMNPGGAFGSVQSVYYGGTNKGIADVVQNYSSATNSYSTVLSNPGAGMIWKTGKATVKNVNAASYQFLSLDQTLTISNTGVLTKSLATTGWTYPWAGSTLTAAQMDQLILIPTTVDLVSSANGPGTWVANTSTANLVCNTGGVALSTWVAGDWLYLLGNSTQIEMHQITQVVNNTFMILDSAPTVSNTSIAVARAYPKNLPIPLSTRSGCSANVSANGTVLNVNIGFAINQTVSEPVTLTVPIQISSAIPQNKTINRDGFVMINCANSAGSTSGPWSLGVPDAFRLKGVYVGNSSVSNTGTNYSSIFWIDNNQNEDFVDLSRLVLDPTATSPLNSSSYILVQFDYYTTPTTGFYATPSYTHTSNTVQLVVQDTTAISNLTSVASTWEVPQFFTDNGIEVDLLGCVDFRPIVQATVTPGTNATSAPINPANTFSFSTTEKLFPVSGTTFSSNVEYFIPRMDSLYVDQTGQIAAKIGDPLTASGTSPAVPAGTMKIADFLIPEWPNLPANRSMNQTLLVNTRVMNSKYMSSRIKNHSISLLSSISQDAAKVYTNADIADMDKRLKNVEYYVNLNQLETAVQSMVIPSSSDPAVNRYQYGFFADDFTTNNLMDTSYPTFKAAIENNDVVPTKLTWDVFMGNQFTGAQPYITQKILSQENATIGDHTDPTAQPQCAVSLANTVAWQLVYRNAYDFNGLPPQDGQVDFVTVKLADSSHMAGANAATKGGSIDSASTNNLGSGVVTLFFYSYDNPVQFQILQGNTVVADSSQAVNLSSNDITNLTTGSVMNQWFNDQTSLYLKNFVAANATFVEFAGKVTWNYSGSGDTSMTIKTTNGTGVRNWRWVVSYPINGDSAGCTPPPPDHTCPPGYHWSDSAGGCVIDTPTPQPIPPKMINIDWTQCLNHGFYGAVQQLIQLQNEGYTIGTITFEGQAISPVPVTGTLAEWMNPLSWQNVLTAGWWADQGTNINGQGLNFVDYYNQLTGKGSPGYYQVVGNQVNYVSSTGQVSAANSTSSWSHMAIMQLAAEFPPTIVSSDNPSGSFIYTASS